MSSSSVAARPAKESKTKKRRIPAATPAPAAEVLDDLGVIDDSPLPAAVIGLDDPRAAVLALLVAARRILVPIRRGFVQRPRDPVDPDANRQGPLGRLVAGRKHVALDLLLLRIALDKVIGEDDPITGKAFARLLSTPDHKVSPSTISRAWQDLAELNLVRWDPGRGVTLFTENGTGEDYAHPGEKSARDKIGYFSLPRRYWTDGWNHDLSLPGKAMLLVLLAETNNPKTPSFSMTAEKLATNYGLGLSTVRRGLQELADKDLLQERWTKVAAPRSPVGYTKHPTYWLKNPFSTAWREVARKKDQAEARKRHDTSSTVSEEVNGDHE